MATVLTAIHVVAAIFMILVVLLQAGKGSGMGAAFGGGASQASFGSGGGLSLLGKITAGAAVVFMLTSMSLAYLSSHSKSLVDSYVPPAPAAVEVQDLMEAPAVPTEEAPVIPTEEAPVIPTEEVPVIPTEEAPVIPTEEVPVIPTEEVPAAE